MVTPVTAYSTEKKEADGTVGNDLTSRFAFAALLGKDQKG